MRGSLLPDQAEGVQNSKEETKTLAGRKDGRVEPM